MSATSPFNFDFKEEDFIQLNNQRELEEIKFPKIEEEELPKVITGRDKFKAAMGIPKGTSEKMFRDIVSAAYTAYIDVQGIPTVEDIKRVWPVLTLKKISEVVITPEFETAMKHRGVPWRPNDFSGLSISQQYAISIITDPTQKGTLRDKLRRAGVSYPQYRAWLKQPAFSRYLNKVTEGMLTDHKGDLHTKLMEKALGGDLNAIKYVHELSGRHDPAAKQIQDLSRIIEMLIEIIGRNVTDQVTLIRINDEIQQVIRGNTIKGEISG